MNCKTTLITLILATSLVPPAAAQFERQVSVEASTPEELAATDEWTEVAEDLWQRDLDGVQAQLAFGETALALSLESVEADIRRLAKPQSRQQQIDLLELELRRDELLAAAERMQSPNKSSSSQNICGGTATFTHWYGQTWFYTYAVRSTSHFGMPGPVSPYTKTAYARAKACSGSYCDEPTPVSNSTTSYAVTSEVEASRGPASGAAREAYGYVLVTGACTDVKFLSTSVPN